MYCFLFIYYSNGDNEDLINSKVKKGNYMEDNVLWVCTYCKIVPSSQSSKKCFRCGRKLTLWDRSKDPMERQPEWPKTNINAKETIDKNLNYYDYTHCYKKRGDK